jgi:CMP/dCMP kinase
LNNAMIIAIDGPAGAGKSTVSKLLARELGYTYLDSGAMYRALAWALLRENLDGEAEAQIAQHLPELPLKFSIDRGSLLIHYREKALGAELRNPEMAAHASRISQMQSVRTFLTKWQRRLSKTGGVVAEGRDTATVVFPHAQVKVFLTASLAARVGRRHAEYLGKGMEVEYSELERQIRDRDEADSNRCVAPLRPAEGAVVLDTSDLDIPRVVSRLMDVIRAKSHG